jgi:hypothetical protein
MTTDGAASTSPTTEFLLSRGRRGVPNVRELDVLPEAGYAIVRSPQPAGTDDHTRSSYLFLSAAFHSRTHKHADDLTFTWYDREQEILIDAGRYGYVELLPKDSPLRLEGYYYRTPERQYAEATRAHNTVEVDGRDHVRRGRQPYGSAIRTAEKRNGHFVLRAQVDHGFWHHDRAIVLRPGHWLYVVDTVEARDGVDHDFRTWWNLAGEVTPHRDDDGRLAVELPGSADTLWIAELGGSELMEPVTGQLEPMRGWRSKRDLQLTPAWSTGFVACGTRRHRFQTLFSFGARPSVEPPAVVAALLKSD